MIAGDSRPHLSTRLQLVYASGMMGWSILVNLIGVVLPYFYLPPSSSGLVNLISQITILGVLNLLAIITASGRLVDAVYDPFIGQLSDKTKNKLGRRIPFMRLSILPAAIFCALVFYPPHMGEHIGNAWWLAVMLVLFFVTSTTFIIPYNALLPELAHNDSEKVKLSSFQQGGFVLGIVFAATVNNLADLINAPTRMESMQYAVWLLCGIGIVFMAIAAWGINEKKYCHGVPTTLDLIPALRESFKNRNFRIYLAADFLYYMSLYIITSGLLYFLTVLCNLPESLGVVLMGTMVFLSLLCYPLINYLAGKFGKKKVVLAAFLLLASVFVCVFFLGKLPMGVKAQIFLLVSLAAFPLAALGILPPAILADIAEKDAEETGEYREGLYFAVKYFIVKLGQTLGIALFAALTLYGKDPGNDWGLRLNGVFGAGLCFLAATIFLRFKEVSDKK